MPRLVPLLPSVAVILLSGPATVMAQVNSLRQPASISKAIRRAPAQDVLDFLSEKYEFKIRIDDATFQRLGAVEIGTKAISIPRMDGVPLEFILEAAAQQIGGTLRRDETGLAIVPGGRKIETLLGPATNELKTKLCKEIKIKRSIDNADWEDVLEFLGEKGEIEIVVAEWQFPPARRRVGAAAALPVNPRVRRRSPSRFADVRVSLPAESRTLEKWLMDLVARVDGRVIARDNVILILPAGRERS